MKNHLDYIIDRGESHALSDDAALVAEIAERLIELEDLRAGYGADFVRRLSELYIASPDGFRSTLELLHGNTSATGQSFSEASSRLGVKKQTMHWRWNKQVKKVGAAFPELAHALSDQRKHWKHGEAMSLSQIIKDSAQHGDN